jgi:biotin synthase
MIRPIADKVLSGGEVTPHEAAALAGVCGPDVHDLLYWANRIRERFCGDEIHLCSIVNARSGACPEDCIFCAQSARHSANVPAFPMLAPEQIVSAGRDAARRGAVCVGIVTSGPDPGSERDLQTVCEAAAELSATGAINVCTSLGHLTVDQARRLAVAGVQRIHHNVETSRRFFPSICTTHGYEDRVRTVRAAKAAGLEVCSGGIFGLGESWTDRVEMALELRELDVCSVPINFLNPIPGTPCEHNELLAPLDCLKIIALFRFVLPRKLIKTAGGRERNLRDLQSWMYYAGANGTMTGNYLTTAGRAPEEDLQMIADLGLRPQRHSGRRTSK